MFRAALELLIFLLVMGVLRSVLGIFGKFFSGAVNTSTGQAGASSPRSPSAQVAGELKKDPVCGTFISTATAFQKSVKGDTYYFCSTDCRDKFQG